jgi:P4 family phage/plasmid primase-like protien
LAINDSPDAVDAARFIIKNPEEKIAAGMTRIEWLKDLSDQICSLHRRSTTGPADPVGDVRFRLAQTLVLKFGEPVFKIKTKSGSEKKLNTLHFAAYFGHTCLLEYDDKVGCFYHYNEKAGCWQPLSLERSRRILVDFIIPFMHVKPLVYTGTPAFQETIIEQAKATNIQEEFRPDGYMFGTLNKTLFLDTSGPLNQPIKIQETGNHWSYKIRNAIPVAFDRKHTGCTKFRTMLTNIMHADDVDLFQYWCGLAIIGKNPLHKMLILPGEAGSGKSTVANIVERMIGEVNVATLTTQRLEDRFELSEFFGKTLLVGKDVTEDFLSCKGAGMLKSLTGDSNLKAEVKYVQARVRLGSPFNVLIVSNHHLYIRPSDDTGAWKRRIWVIPVKKKAAFPIDRTFSEKLVENEGTGILCWMLEGARRVLHDIKNNTEYKLQPHQDANAMALLAKRDELADFCQTRLAPKAGNIEASEDIYDAYCQYCGGNKQEAIAQTIFYRRIGRYITEIPGAAGPKTIPGEGNGKAFKAYTGIVIQKIKPSTSPVAAKTDEHA